MLADRLLQVESERCNREIAVNKIMDDLECISISIVRCIEAGKPITISHTYVTEDTIKCLRYIGLRVGDVSWANYKFVPHKFYKLEKY